MAQAAETDCAAGVFAGKQPALSAVFKTAKVRNMNLEKPIKCSFIMLGNNAAIAHQTEYSALLVE